MTLRKLAIGLLFALSTIRVLVAGIFSELRDVKLNDQGNVAFVAAVQDQRQALRTLFFSRNDGSLMTIASPGQSSPVPGFKFAPSAFENFALNKQNNIIFDALITDGKGVFAIGVFFYSHSDGKLRAVLTSDLSGPPKAGFVSSRFSLNDQDEIAFVFSSGTCPSTGNCDTTSQLFLYNAATDSLTEIAKQGEAAPGGGEYLSIQQPLFNNLGTLVFFNVKPRVGPIAVFRKFKGRPIEKVVANGDQVPAAGGGILDFGPGLFREPILNNRDTFVFTAALKDSKSLGGIFAVRRDNRFVAVALDKQTVGDSETFLDMTQQGVLSGLSFLPPIPHLNDSDLVAFSAKTNKGVGIFLVDFEQGSLSPVPLPAEVQANGQTVKVSVTFFEFNNRSEFLFLIGEGAVLLREPSGDFRLILDKGHSVPTLSDAVFTYFASLGLNNRQFLFLGQFRLGEKQQTGLFVLNIDSGEIRKVVITGEQAPASAPLATIVFAQFADGRVDQGSFQTSLLLINPSFFSSSAAVKFRDSKGSPAPVKIGNELNDTFAFSVPACGSLAVETSPGPLPTSGYVIVESGGELSGVEIFSLFSQSGERQTEAGVLPSTASKKFSIAAQAKGDLNTGLALVNLTSERAELSFEARDEQGQLVATAKRNLDPSQHLALFVAKELFAGLTTFLGKVEITSSVPVYKVTLRTTSTTMTSFPVLQ